MKPLITRAIAVFVVICACLLACGARQQPNVVPQRLMAAASQVQFHGVNRAGAEYGDDWDGWTGQSYYEVPNQTVRANEFAYFKARGMNCLRFPISWERIQHSLNGPLDPTYQAQVVEYVNAATAAGLMVILDLHNYGRYATGAFSSSGTQTWNYVQRTLGDGTLTFTSIADVWTRLAPLFKTNQLVVFNLMNEQHDAVNMNSTTLFAGYQTVLNAVRATGATQLVLFPNTRSSDVHHWATWSPQGGPLDVIAAIGVVDSANNLAYDMHSYEGNDTWNSDIPTVTAWARANGKRLFLSEVGTTSGAAAVTTVLSHLNANSDVWMGWTVWNLDPYNVTNTDLSSGIVTDTSKMSWYAPFFTAPPPPPTCTYTYSAWSACQSNGTQQRTASALPVGCVGTPSLSQACVYVPPVIDTDGDGILDNADMCPKVKGIPTTALSTNGCAALTVTAVKTYDWGSGYCKQFTFKNVNPMPMPWKTMILYLKDAHLRGPDAVWGANFSNTWATGTVVVTPSGDSPIAGNSSLQTVGFCADFGPSGYVGTSGGLTY